jgi:hypothetical protein
MPGFKTHVTLSSAIGVGYGWAACHYYGVPWPTGVLAAGLCGVSGMLPDLDSDSGRPLRESVALAAAVIPMMLIPRFQRIAMPHEMMILVGGAVYLSIRFGLAGLLKQCTAHRGMFHSLPAAVVAGEIALLLCTGEDLRLRIYTASAVVLGYMSHLALDELWGMRWGLGPKHSLGSAVKLYSHSFWANAMVAAELVVLTLAIYAELGRPAIRPPLPWADENVMKTGTGTATNGSSASATVLAIAEPVPVFIPLPCPTPSPPACPTLASRGRR